MPVICLCFRPPGVPRVQAVHPTDAGASRAARAGHQPHALRLRAGTEPSQGRPRGAAAGCRACVVWYWHILVLAVQCSGCP